MRGHSKAYSTGCGHYLKAGPVALQPALPAAHPPPGARAGGSGGGQCRAGSARHCGAKTIREDLSRPARRQQQRQQQQQQQQQQDRQVQDESPREGHRHPHRGKNGPAPCGGGSDGDQHKKKRRPVLRLDRAGFPAAAAGAADVSSSCLSSPVLRRPKSAVEKSQLRPAAPPQNELAPGARAEDLRRGRSVPSTPSLPDAAPAHHLPPRFDLAGWEAGVTAVAAKRKRNRNKRAAKQPPEDGGDSSGAPKNDTDSDEGGATAVEKTAVQRSGGGGPRRGTCARKRRNSWGHKERNLGCAGGGGSPKARGKGHKCKRDVLPQICAELRDDDPDAFEPNPGDVGCRRGGGASDPPSEPKAPSASPPAAAVSQLSLAIAGLHGAGAAFAPSDSEPRTPRSTAGFAGGRTDDEGTPSTTTTTTLRSSPRGLSILVKPVSPPAPPARPQAAPASGDAAEQSHIPGQQDTQQRYAGPTFHNSPAPSALPVPAFAHPSPHGSISFARSLESMFAGGGLLAPRATATVTVTLPERPASAVSSSFSSAAAAATTTSSSSSSPSNGLLPPSLAFSRSGSRSRSSGRPRSHSSAGLSYENGNLEVFSAAGHVVVGDRLSRPTGGAPAPAPSPAWTPPVDPPPPPKPQPAAAAAAAAAGGPSATRSGAAKPGRESNRHLAAMSESLKSLLNIGSN